MKFEIDTNQLASAVQRMQETLSEIEIGKIKMYKALETLDGMWEGVAHDTFKVQYSSDDQMMRQLCERIRSVIESNDNARTSYDSCEQSVVDQINRISI